MTHQSSASTKSNSRPTSPYVEPDRNRARGYTTLSPQREHHNINSSNNGALRTTASSSTDNILSSRYAAAPRSAGMSSIDTPQTSRFAHGRGLSMDGTSTNSILPTDKPIIRVIFDTGRSCVVNIDGCITVEEIMLKTLRKGNLNEAHVKNYCFYVLDNTEPNPALCRRINDAEVMRICSDKMRPERNRLILRKIHQGEPDEEQLKTAAGIAAQIAAASGAGGAGNIFVPTNPKSQLKIKQITGEALPPISYPQSPASISARERHIFTAQQDHVHHYRHLAPRTRMKEVFGGRPPSELIASDLPTYFPNFAQDEIDRTVRMSIRRSRRISRATNRLSIASNISITSEIGRDAPPMPSLPLGQMQGLPSITDPYMKDQARTMRPLSVLRLGGGFRDSVASSVLERLDEESPLDESSRKSFASYMGGSEVSITDPEGHTVMQSYYDDGRSSIANSVISEDVNADPSNSLNKRLSQLVHEDSEESDEELNEYLEADSWDNIKYMQGALIGQGSFGSVYIALHAVSGELMAVKQVEMPNSPPTDSADGTATSAPSAADAKKNTMVDALKHEIGLLRELKHPNIVQYLGSNTESSRLNIFLEYVPGGSVASMLVNYGPLGESLIANFVRQILTGLAYLHSKGIIHRDIKGANILVDNKGSVKISDFGISKRVEASTLLNNGSGSSSISAKRAGASANRVSLQGSVFWMAPEVVKQTAYTRKADIWSLGCLIVEMLTGQHPHPNCSQLQAIFKIGRGSGEQARPTVPDVCSPELKEFLGHTFELEHEKRPEAEELLQSSWLAGAAAEGKQ
jgi:mitogen-activated protein kinase kinase kinase